MAEEIIENRWYLLSTRSNLLVIADTLPLYAKGLDGVLGFTSERYISIENTCNDFLSSG